MTNKVSEQDIDDLISDSKIEYTVIGGKLTICAVTLPSNYIVYGTSSCVDNKNFSKKIGERIAFINMKDELWKLEGYLLAYKLSQK